MYMLGLAFVFFFTWSARRTNAATTSSIATPHNITDNVLKLNVHDYRAKSLRKRQPPQQAEDDLFFRDSMYTVPVRVGDQDLNLEINMGSLETWVATPYFFCVDKERVQIPQDACRIGPYYEPSPELAKELLTREGGEWSEIVYASGSFVNGKVFEKQIGIGGVSRGSPYWIKELKIGMPNEGHWTGNGIASGVLGLAMPRQPDRPSILGALFKDENIPAVLSLALAHPDSESEPRGGGVIGFGGIPNILTDDNWDSTPIKPPPMTRLGSTIIPIMGFHIMPDPGDRSELPLTSSEVFTPLLIFSHNMAVDSTTSVIRVPHKVAKYTALLFRTPLKLDPATGLYRVSCEGFAPRFGIRINEKTFFIPTSDLRKRISSFGPDECALMIQPSERNDLTLGTPFLRNVLAVFDYSGIRNGKQHGVLQVVGRRKRTD
ncbi:aspartic peptidase domain-containing protein [Ampelomyces quisqualis]|uniref:Aspartic peptidase domain-containing protein n=1 Tax=Ampelomyces quisqualis TaxID=50730 RepID=A0A6A5QHR1_AMPQU|nr:aspartic peptidase domain-containing protein [Ampelomyces quisqualis]